MGLKVYNSLTRKRQEFKPLHDKKVNMFVCGQTVYDDAHLGHAKTYVQFDMIVRWLRKLEYNVFYIQNITDIEDKIINRAKESGIDPLELSRKYAGRYLEDLDSLGVKKNVNMFPKTTDYIPQMIEQIKTLVDKGYAYVVDGDVYYDVTKFKDYTKLSRMPLEELKKHRIEPDKRKKNSFDFSLWKSQKPGELAWDSPWGKGRPGWHIEDTAMTVTIFKAPQYDLHGGATELIFPHHTNEIAQAEAATGKKPFVKYWLHTGVLAIGGVEMHKSLKNFITIREMLKKYSPEVLRLYYASTQYRKPINFDEKDVKQAQNKLESLYNTLRNLKQAASSEGKTDVLTKELAETKKKFADAMNNDFNTPLALAHLFALAKKANKMINEKKIEAATAGEVTAVFRDLGSVLGILEGEVEGAEIPKEVEELVKERENARTKKDWKRADALREEIRKRGFLVEDTAEGPRCIRIKA